MDNLVRGWGKYWLDLSNISVNNAYELQHKDSAGEWIKREPETGEYIFADSNDEIEEINERFESAEHLRRTSAQRVIRATVSNPNFNYKIFEGIPEDKSPYNTNDLLDITPNLVEIYEVITPEDSGQLAKHGSLIRDDDGSAFFIFRLNPEEFDNALQLLLQPNTKFHMECSLNGWVGLIEGGGQVVCLDSKRPARAELFNLGTNRIVPDSADTHEDQGLEHRQELSELEEWIVLSITKLDKRLEDSEKHLGSIQITNWITAIAIISVVITLLV